MIRCPKCQKEINEDALSCPSCGLSFDEATRQLDSRESPAGDPGRKGSTSARSFDSIDDSRFVPGTILADRFRIIGLLGRGGMGEVYRADDLKLGQPVALKFLPGALAGDAVLLERFHGEARNARQVSHPNVCRVYDIGEVDGQHFLSMEYVDGEDLAALLHRIGRLPATKALEIARAVPPQGQGICCARGPSGCSSSGSSTAPRRWTAVRVTLSTGSQS